MDSETTRMGRIAEYARYYPGLCIPREDAEARSHLTPTFLQRVFDVTDQQHLLAYLRGQVWNNAYRTHFWLHGPLHKFTLHLATTTRVDEHGLCIMQESVARGAEKPRMACSLHSCVACHLHTLSPTETTVLCELMCAIMENEDARGCLLEVDLLRSMTEKCQGDGDLLSKVLDVFLLGRVTDFPLAFLMAERTVHELLLHSTSASLWEKEDSADGSHLRKCLSFLETLAACVEWHAFLTEWVVALSLYGWPISFGRLVANMLSTPSVQLLLELKRRDKLALLIRAAHRYVTQTSDASWCVSHRRLRTAWPTQFALVLNCPAANTVPSSVHECPITLQKCANPVVASDGHTYERDALLRYMSDNVVAVSPMTKVQLMPMVFDNFAIRT